MDKLETIRKALTQIPTSQENISNPREYQIGIVDLLKALGQFWVEMQETIRNELQGML